MSRESHRQHLERAALREAQRAFSRCDEPATLRAFLALRVQTVEPWKRIACVLIGCAFAGMAGWLAVGHRTNIWAVGFLAATGLTSLVIGIVGWKSPVESVLQGTAEALFNRLLDAL